MKFLLLFCLTLFAPFVHATEEVITPQLLTLLDHFHLEHDGTLASINEAAQKAWLRQQGKERWETEDKFTASDREAVLEYYTQTGKFQEKAPSKPYYNFGMVCGATVGPMRARLDYFTRHFQSGVKVDQLVLLAGARPLDFSIEKVENCLTEGDAMMFLWKQSPLFNKVDWKYLEQPMIQTKEGFNRRPTTYDTFLFWLGSHPQGSALIVVNQPYCCYFEAIAEWAFSDAIDFEVVGYAATPDSQKTDTLLDNLARWIYVHSRINSK